jgi:hypothetical protein
VSANPQVPESANVKASAIVASFIVVSLIVQIRDNRSITNKTSVKLPMWPTVHNTADLMLSGLKFRNRAAIARLSFMFGNFAFNAMSRKLVGQRTHFHCLAEGHA